jgi:sRNA-binding carbon storage regulator CsrA
MKQLKELAMPDLSHRAGEALVFQISDGPIPVMRTEYQDNEPCVGVEAPATVRVLRAGSMDQLADVSVRKGFFR